jgi:predicted RNA-binding protein with PIN domain
MTVVFDGWLGGWATEKKEVKRGIEVIYSKLGEKADEVIKRLVREKGSEAIVITSDREISRFAERMDAAVIACEQFLTGPKRDSKKRMWKKKRELRKRDFREDSPKKKKGPEPR